MTGTLIRFALKGRPRPRAVQGDGIVIDQVDNLLPDDCVHRRDAGVRYLQRVPPGPPGDRRPLKPFFRMFTVSVHVNSSHGLSRDLQTVGALAPNSPSRGG